MSKRTPIAEKVRKSTPKTGPKKLMNAPTNMDVSIDLKRASFRRTKRGLDDSASFDVASICTPTRTTRSMARHDPDDMQLQIPSFVTPSKRNTIATPKSSAKKLLAKEQGNTSDGEFVRPRTPKIKVNDVTLANDSINESVSPAAKPKRQSVKARKSSNTPVKEGASSEVDLRLVLNQKSSAKKAGRFVRSKKSTNSSNDAESTDEESLLSVSKLGQDLNSSTKKAGRFVRSHKLLANNSGIGSTDDEDLPSVSLLAAAKSSPGRYARSPKWLEKNGSQDENVLNNSKTSARKSNGAENQAIHAESNENGSNDDNNDHNKSANGKVALTADPTIENGSNAETTSEPTNLEPVAIASKSTRRSKQKVKEQTESSDDGLPSVSFLGTQLKSARKSMKRKADMANELSPVKRTVKFTSPIIIEHQKSDLEASYDTVSDKRNDSEEVAAQNSADEASQNGDQKPLAKNRMSVIDLTDSPVNSNRTQLNTTFSPKVQPTTAASETMDGTFTEVDNKEALDKTFSPVSSTSAHVAYSTPLLVLGSPSKPMSKKKSPLLKRLKGTPMRKPAHNLNTPGKLSSAKKAKMLETAQELCNSSVKKQQMKPSKNASTPKMFRFGDDDNNKAHDFRFSLLAPALNPNNPQNNREYHNLSVPTKH